MPEWARENPQEYWAAANRYERANGRLYREVHFALPNELGKGEQKELAQSFARDLTTVEKQPQLVSTNLPGERIRASSCSRLKISWAGRASTTSQATDVTFQKAQRVRPNPSEKQKILPMEGETPED